jgi:hypothetical protein
MLAFHHFLDLGVLLDSLLFLSMCVCMSCPHFLDLRNLSDNLPMYVYPLSFLGKGPSVPLPPNIFIFCVVGDSFFPELAIIL